MCQEREALKVYFQSEKKIDRKNMLLQYLKAQDNLSISTECFNWKGVAYCESTFSGATGISKYILNEVLNGHRGGVKAFVHANKSTLKFSIGASKFRAWMKSFLERYSQSDPEKIV